MKEIYLSPEMDLIEFEAADVITSSESTQYLLFDENGEIIEE